MLPVYQNIPFVCIFLCMISGISMPLFKKGRSAYRLMLFVCAVVTVLSFILMARLSINEEYFVYQMGHFPAPWGNELSAGPLEAMLCVMFGSVMGLSLLGGRKTMTEDILEPKQRLYFAMISMLLASMLAMTYSNDIFTDYVFIEISTIAACAIVMARDTAKTIAATIRYLIISLLGSGLFLIGVVLLYCITGHLLMPNIQQKILEIIADGSYTVPLTMVVGLLTIGIAIKSALFPFYAWLPYAHGGATTASSAILSGLVLKGYIVMLMKIFYRVFTIEAVRSLRVTNVMFVFGIAGMIVGSIGALKEEHIKRMLAYSSIAQIGYIFMGIGLGTDLGIVAAFFHMLVHAAAKPLLFLCAGRLSEVQGHEKSLYRLRGAALKDKLAGAGFTVGALSMIGIPLFAGFVSKYFFADASLFSGYKMWPALLALAASSVLNALYYVPAVMALWTPSVFSKIGGPVKNTGFAISAPILTAAVILLGCCAAPVVELIGSGLALL